MEGRVKEEALAEARKREAEVMLMADSGGS